MAVLVNRVTVQRTHMAHSPTTTTIRAGWLRIPTGAILPEMAREAASCRSQTHPFTCADPLQPTGATWPRRIASDRTGSSRGSGCASLRESSGGETRTLNLAVNSRLLCRLSYPGNVLRCDARLR